MASKAKIEHYRPSNGSEGMWFEDQFCEICAKMGKDGNPPHCMIWGSMMVDEQRDEWCYIDKKPTCTAFQTHEQSAQEKKIKQHEDLKNHGQTYF